MALNEMQKKAVETTEGPLLILAGAGSGKTTVLVNRVQHIIEDGYALPWQVLAITFTNKAAGEIRERLTKAIGEEAESIWAYTFHSCCSRILRRFADRLGYSNHFTIYDTDDSKRVIKRCQKQLEIEDKYLSYKAILSEISKAKDSLVDFEEYKQSAFGDFRLAKIADCYELYQKELKKSDAMDFDDIIFNTVKLLRENDDVLELYQKQFKYVMVDEYQDTNHAQYVLTSLLAGGYKNICVVGDDDQSIYRFRGATIQNILNFEDEYENACVIRLEQNYRSTQNVLDAANGVISNNKNRKGKRLFTDSGKGDKVVLYTSSDENDESRFIVDEIEKNVKNGMKFSDHAILFRMNVQSRNIELSLTKSGIPNKVIGGMRFFDRKEIKDIVSYLSVINNKNDNVRLQRIINVPKRAIGETTVSHAMEIATHLELSLFEVCEHADEYAKISRASSKLKNFTSMMNEISDDYYNNNMTLSDLLQEVLDKTGYLQYLNEEDPERYEDRKMNIQELSSMFVKYEEEQEDFTLEEFLEDVALVSDIDSYNEDDDSVVMMTLHSAKGLEFPVVFIPGMEEGIFPGMQSIAEEESCEEERRLAYVGITRARQKLYLINSKRRMLFGSTQYNQPSRFLAEIPVSVTEVLQNKREMFSGESHFGTPKKVNPYAKSTPIGTAKKSSSNSWQFGQVKNTASTAKVQYNVGDAVRHNAFGTGVILSSKPMGNDVLLEISFDRAGTKKMMANYAKLEKL